jgi:hypothetical protein
MRRKKITTMMRRDALGSDERPHYYSKFWIEVALGQAGLAPLHVGETAAPEEEYDEFEEAEREFEMPTPAPKPAPKPRAEKKVEPQRPVLTSLADLANIDRLMQDSAAMDAAEVPDIEGGAIEDLAPFTAEPEEELAGEAEEVPASENEEDMAAIFDEDEEEDEWGGSGRRPRRPPQRPPKRERRPY